MTTSKNPPLAMDTECNPAESMRELLAALAPGECVASPLDWQVRPLATPDMTVRIRPGCGFIELDWEGENLITGSDPSPANLPNKPGQLYFWCTCEQCELDISPNETREIRTDIVVACIADAAYPDGGAVNNWEMMVIEGIPGQGPPPLPPTCMLLAEVEVPPFATSIVGANIDDKRTICGPVCCEAEVCGRGDDGSPPENLCDACGTNPNAWPWDLIQSVDWGTDSMTGPWSSFAEFFADLRAENYAFLVTWNPTRCVFQFASLPGCPAPDVACPTKLTFEIAGVYVPLCDDDGNPPGGGGDPDPDPDVPCEAEMGAAFVAQSEPDGSGDTFRDEIDPTVQHCTIPTDPLFPASTVTNHYFTVYVPPCDGPFPVEVCARFELTGTGPAFFTLTNTGNNPSGIPGIGSPIIPNSVTGSAHDGTFAGSAPNGHRPNVPNAGVVTICFDAPQGNDTFLLRLVTSSPAPRCVTFTGVTP